jgi:lysosomal acid lipase/cholesteryl ester hydrolase
MVIRIYNLLHWAQITRTGRFEAYDYGESENIIIYDSEHPLSFDVASITAPVAVLYGDNDYLSNPEDVEFLLEELPNVIYSEKVIGFRHNDFVWGKHACGTIYKKVIELIGLYHQELREKIERVEEKIENEPVAETVVEKNEVGISE